MADERTGAVVKKPLVGFNYPIAWNAYGFYFGGGNPPGSNPAIDIWTDNLKKNLKVLRDELNIGIVRIFLLGNALNYGSFTAGSRGNPSRFVLPPVMHPKFKEHLEKMLLAFRDASMLVIPSIIDFKAIGRKLVLRPGRPAKTVNGSRVKGSDAVTNGCTDRTDIVKVEAIRNGFFAQIRENLLLPSVPFRNNIYAWEVQNEPAWNVRRVAPSTVAGGKTVDDEEMAVFLKQGVETIEGVKVGDQPAFKSTVGHRFISDLDEFPTGGRRQFHFYPFTVLGFSIKEAKLPPFSETNAFIGEIGAMSPEVGHGDPWPELEGADEADTRTRVVARLQHVRDKGYPLVFLWPDGVDGKGFQPPLPGPDPVQLSKEAQDGVKDFMKAP